MDHPYQYIVALVFTFLRYFIIAGLAFVFFYKLFPKKFSDHKIQKRIAKTKDFVREISHSFQTTFILAGIGLLFIKTPLVEYTKFYENINDYPSWWIPLSIVLGLLIHDAYFYWMHKTIHHPKIFRKIHLLHHKSTNPSPWASYSFHITESILEALIAPILLMIIPMHPLSLLTFALLSFLFNVYGHLGYEIAPKWFRNSFLFEILNTSTHHNLHHEKFKGNYGLYFRFWDRIMGTEHPNYVEHYDDIQRRRFSKTKSSALYYKRKFIITILIFILGLLSISATFKPSEKIEGKWKFEENGAVVLIYEKDALFFGKLIDSGNKSDNEKLKNKGELVILKNFQKKSSTQFCCGTLFAPKKNKTIDATLTLENENTLKITGKYGFISRHKILKRVE